MSEDIILVVDDQPERTESTFEMEAISARVQVVHPSKLTEANLGEAHLVLVDYRIEDWPERDELASIALRPPNGLALAVLLRERADAAVRSRNGKTVDHRLCAFALHSGHLDDILGRLREKPRPHIIAKLNNLEWAFSKDDPDRFRKMSALASAVRQLPAVWPTSPEGVEKALRDLLGLDSQLPWAERSWRDVLSSRAPIDELLREKHSMLPLRWLMHQVLPYPTFLWPMHWVAARLGITIECFGRIVKEDNQLARELKEMRYKGLLAEFLGEHWWKGALEDYVWDLAGATKDQASLRMALEDRAGQKLHHISGAPLVVCLHSDLTPGDLVSASEAVRIKPDHWPSFADDPWVRLDMLEEDPSLRALVDPLDLEEIDSGEGAH